MKKLRACIPLLCLCLSISISACQSSDNNTSVTAAPQNSLSTAAKNDSEQQSVTEHAAEDSPTETEVNAEKRGLPEGVVLSSAGNLTITDEEPDEVVYSEDGIWLYAQFNDFIYASEPDEAEFQKYRTGDILCGLTVKSANFVFVNMYMDNEYHDSCRVNSRASFDGSVTVTGTLHIAKDDGANLLYKENDILFTPDEPVFPIMGGFFEGENFYDVFCGNINDEDLCGDVKELTVGENIRANITVSDISLIVEMGTPVSGRAYCKIDSLELL